MHPFLPITSLVALPRINDVRFSRCGHYLLRHETVEGRGVLSLNTDPETRVLISSDLDVRGSIGYGGGEFDAGEYLAVMSVRSQGLFSVRLDPPYELNHLTPEIPVTASACISPDEKNVLLIQSHNESEAIAVTNLHGHSSTRQIVSGADFYMQVAWHPLRPWVAWVEWDHPHMPWDASRIQMAELNLPKARLSRKLWEAGGTGAPANQPRFSPDGNWMTYIIRAGEWDNLVIRDLNSGHERILVPGNGFHLRLPEWVLGMHSYAWSGDSRAIYYFRYQHAATTLWKVEIGSAASQPIDILPIRWATQLDVPPHQDEIVFIGSAPGIPRQVCRRTGGVLKREIHELEEQLADFIRQPEHLQFPTAGGGNAYGLYYPPAMQPGEIPPLILHIHSGPTGLTDLGFNHEAAYFTSRGYGFAEVNYRGSSTYGYSYQDALRENWGVVDVQDVIAMANHLIERGWAHPTKLAVFGSSAGGFTVLNTLICQPGMFKCGVCSYGVSDLVADARTTHKFEKFYHRFLVGNLETDIKRFQERSPICHADRIQDPLLLFHGDEDPVVDIAQTHHIYQQLKQRGVPCQIVIYSGEGHGFRKKETISDYYQKIESFLSCHLK